MRSHLHSRLVHNFLLVLPYRERCKLSAVTESCKLETRLTEVLKYSNDNVFYPSLLVTAQYTAKNFKDCAEGDTGCAYFDTLIRDKLNQSIGGRMVNTAIRRVTEDSDIMITIERTICTSCRWLNCRAGLNFTLHFSCFILNNTNRQHHFSPPQESWAILDAPNDPTDSKPEGPSWRPNIVFISPQGLYYVRKWPRLAR